MFYLEPRSGELMERYENPWTGESNEPPAMKMGPYRNRHTVTGAEIILPDNIPPGLNDSKKLTDSRREMLFERIIATSCCGWSASPDGA